MISTINVSVDSDICFNAETIEAIEEAKAIREGRIQTESYSSAKELFDELDTVLFN